MHACQGPAVRMDGGWSVGQPAHGRSPAGHSECHSAHGAAEQWASCSSHAAPCSRCCASPPLSPPQVWSHPALKLQELIPAGSLAVSPPLPPPPLRSPHLVRSHPALVQLQQNCLPAALQRHHALGQGLGPRREDHECGTGLKQWEDLWGGGGGPRREDHECGTGLKQWEDLWGGGRRAGRGTS